MKHKNGEHDPIVDLVVERIQERSVAGMKKFGKPMTRDDRTTVEWVDDAIEELLDAAVYLTRVKFDWDKIWQIGYDEGYDEGYEEGYEEGRDHANE